MLIDWFTVIAQLINFLILVYLLNRFLYKPITKTMAKRQERIESRWQEAEQRQVEAKQEADRYRQEQQELNHQRDRLLVEAREQAEQERKQMIQHARQDVEQMQAGWQEAVQRDRDAFLQTVQQQVVQQTDAIVRRVLRDLADADIEQRIITTFLKRLRELDESDRQTLAESVQRSDQEILIRSSFAITQDTQQKIANVLQQEQIIDGHNLNFSTSPDLICGIELQLPDREIAWNIDHYLKTLQERLSVVLREEVETLDELKQIATTSRSG